MHYTDRLWRCEINCLCVSAWAANQWNFRSCEGKECRAERTNSLFHSHIALRFALEVIKWRQWGVYWQEFWCVCLLGGFICQLIAYWRPFICGAITGGRSPESKYTNQPRPPILSAFEGAPAVFLSPRQVAAPTDCVCVQWGKTSEKNSILCSLAGSQPGSRCSPHRRSVLF